MNFIKYSIKNTGVTRFIIFVIVIGGLFSYFKLGKLEDPEFKIKEAIVVTLYPGADAQKVEALVTNKIEEAVQKIPDVEYVESVSKNGYSQVKVKLNESITSDSIDQHWDDLRKKILDEKIKLPTGVVSPIVLDDYGAVYGMFFAITSDGFSYSELENYSDIIKKELSSIQGVSKVEEFGKQKKAIYLEVDKARLINLGINPKIISAAIVSENLISGGASLNSDGDRITISFNNDMDSLKKLEELVVFSKKLPSGENEVLRLKELVEIKKGYVEPYNQKLKYNKKMAIGLSMSPEKGSNVVETGKMIDDKIESLKERLPIGISIEKIYYQPELVTSAINNFVWNLILSVITVVGVLLITMGVKSGLIIGSGLVLSILGTLILMIPMGIDLQRVSLGSFIIAMGMLVDDSIVVVDGVLNEIVKGEEVESSAEKIARKSSIPLLGATVIAAIAFLPGALMPTYAGEYVSSSFWVIGISLLLSWVLCLTQTPVYCKLYLKKEEFKEQKHWEKKTLEKSEKILRSFIENRKKVFLIVGVLLVLSIALFLKIPKTFFPDSDKKGFVVNIWTREGKDIQIVEKESNKLTEFLLEQTGVEKVVESIGASPPRYYVATIPQVGNSSFAQLIISVDKLDRIEEVYQKIEKFSNEFMPGVMVGVKKYPNGVPTEYPVEIEISGNEIDELRRISNEVMDIMKKNPSALNVKTNWRTPVLSWEGDISQVYSKNIGVLPMDLVISTMMFSDGMILGRIQEEDKLIPVFLKNKESDNLKNIGQSGVWGVGAEGNPLSAFLKGSTLKFKENEIWRKNRVRTIKIQCDIPVSMKADEVRNEFKNDIEKIIIPKDYSLKWGGEYKEQEKNVIGILKNVPLTLTIMFTICVFLFADVKLAILIFLTLPLCMIGISPGLFILGRSFGFMSTIGVIALSGMMIKNVIVLVDEINFERENKKEKLTEIVVRSAIGRIRAVSLAAVTTIFGMVTLLTDPLYGDMAATIIFGLFASTVLTLFIFPLIYLVIFEKRDS